MKRINSEHNPSRIVYLDTIRFLAVLWVFHTHFIAAYAKTGWRNLLKIVPFKLVFQGVTGKLAVTVLCIVLGYLACKKGQSKTSTFQYAIRRYIYFFSIALFLNTLYVILAKAEILPLASQSLGIRQILYSSVFLKSNIVGLFWCLRPLYTASLICFINGKYNLSYKEVLIESVIFIFIKETWIGIGILGNLAERLLQEEKVNSVMQKWYVQLVLIIAVSASIKRSESNTTYLIDGICMMMVVMIIANNRWIKGALEFRWWQSCNKHYMGVFINHVIIYKLVTTYIFGGFSTGNRRPQVLLAYFICLVLIILLAGPIEYIVNKLVKVFISCLERFQTCYKAMHAKLKDNRQ